MSDEAKVETEVDPFAPSDSGGKTRFGLLQLFSHPVVLESGASYQIPGVTDKDNNVKNWNGKKISKDSKTRHVVLKVIATDKDGNNYSMLRDHLTGDKPYKTIVHPALMKIFGETKKFPVTTAVPVQFDEVETGESFAGTNRETGEPMRVNKSTWKVTKLFKNTAEMKQAETEFFSKFTNGGESNGNGATASSITPAVPQGYVWTATEPGQVSWKTQLPSIKKYAAKAEAPKATADSTPKQKKVLYDWLIEQLVMVYGTNEEMYTFLEQALELS